MDARLVMAICELVDSIRDNFLIKRIEINKENSEENAKCLCHIKVRWNVEKDHTNLNPQQEAMIQISGDALEEFNCYTAPRRELAKGLFKDFVESRYSKLKQGTDSKKKRSEVWYLGSEDIKLKDE